jgi:N-acyl-D-aspartate/D-glutamate deacylase
MSRPSEYDVLITNGFVYDGTAAPPQHVDIGVKADTIAAIGTHLGSAKVTLDAEGCIVTPGFIDVHTHIDSIDRASLEATGSVEDFNNLYQGVTTVVSGLCGTGETHLEEWREYVHRIRFSTNVYHLIPHGALRAELFGYQTEALTVHQLALMKNRVAKEMAKGAIGLSTGLIYSPGLCADTHELIELCSVVKKYGGLYVSHVRGEDGSSVLGAYKEAIDIGRNAGVPVHISHMKLLKPYNNVTPEQMLSIIEEAREQGMDVTGDQYPYTACGSYLSALLPQQYQAATGVKSEYKTGNGKQKLEESVHKFLSEVRPNEILIVDNPGNPEMNGRYVHEIAASQAISPVEAYVRLLCAYDTVFTAFFIVHEGVMRQIMQKEYVFTGSDSLSPLRAINTPKSHDHPRAYGTFAKKIATYVRDEKLISLSHAIMSMTSRPAKKFNMKRRGTLQVGNFADIAVIDFHAYRDTSTFEHADQYAQGVRHVVVNGVIKLHNGKIKNW